MMVLFALILSLGMLVDNGIVVVENIYRLMEEGYPPIKAAKEGVGEVALPVITSTATTLSATGILARHDRRVHEVFASNLNDCFRIIPCGSPCN